MGHRRHQHISAAPRCSHLVDGAGGGDRQPVFVHNGHVRRPEAVQRGGGVVVVVVFVGAVHRNLPPGAIDEGGVDQMSSALWGEGQSEGGDATPPGASVVLSSQTGVNQKQCSSESDQPAPRPLNAARFCSI